MKFTINTSVFKDVLTAMQGAAERKSTIPVLSNVLILAEGLKLTVSATNLDLSVTRSIDAKIEQAGAICVNAAKLTGIVSNLPANADISFQLDDKGWAEIKSGKSKFRLPGISRENFPTIQQPRKGAATVTLNGDLFAEMIGKVLFAITNEMSRFTLAGAKLIVRDGTVVLVSTDGHRLSYVERKPAEGQPSIEGVTMDMLIPKMALVEAAKMGAAGGMEISEDPNHVFFNAGGQLLTSRKLTGQFPNYEMVMPKDNDKCVIVDGQILKSAVKRIALMADERNRSMRLTTALNELRLNASSSEEGEGNDTLDAEFGGDESSLGFNWRYLGDFLNLVQPEDKVVLLFKDSNAQTEWKIAGDDGFKHIIMPLRI